MDRRWEERPGWPRWWRRRSADGVSKQIWCRPPRPARSAPTTSWSLEARSTPTAGTATPWRFVARHAAELRMVPVWLFSSGPLGDSERPADIPAVRQVDALSRRIGARGPRHLRRLSPPGRARVHRPEDGQDPRRRLARPGGGRPLGGGHRRRAGRTPALPGPRPGRRAAAVTSVIGICSYHAAAARPRRGQHRSAAATAAAP